MCVWWTFDFYLHFCCIIMSIYFVDYVEHSPKNRRSKNGIWSGTITGFFDWRHTKFKEKKVEEKRRLEKRWSDLNEKKKKNKHSQSQLNCVMCRWQPFGVHIWEWLCARRRKSKKCVKWHTKKKILWRRWPSPSATEKINVKLFAKSVNRELVANEFFFVYSIEVMKPIRRGIIIIIRADG